MTTLEILGRAAALMQERAEAAAVSAPSPWFVSEHEIVTEDEEPIETISVITSGIHWRDAAAQRAHVASWHPVVAVEVAKLLKAQVDYWIDGEGPCAKPCTHADCEATNSLLPLAVTYLGEATS